MKKLFVCLAAVSCVLTGAANAFGGSASESGIPTSPLKIYSFGVAGGGLYALNEDFKDTCGQAFGKVVLMNSFDFTENFALFADINWYAGNSLLNFGIDLGGDYYLSSQRVKPFIGAGIGAHYFDRNEAKDDFGAAFGVSATAHVGIALELTKTVDVRVRVPYHIVVDKTKDMGIGVDVGVLFFSNLRNVKSIDY